MKNWNDFLAEYMLRAMTNQHFFEEYSPAHIIDFARLAWDEMQKAELPESEKAKQAPAAPIAANSPDLIPSNSTELKALARTARDLFPDDAQWLAVDANGEVWAFDLKPIVEDCDAWNNNHSNGFSWGIGAVAPPADFINEIYEIDKLLSDDVQ